MSTAHLGGTIALFAVPFVTGAFSNENSVVMIIIVMFTFNSNDWMMIIVMFPNDRMMITLDNDRIMIIVMFPNDRMIYWPMMVPIMRTYRHPTWSNLDLGDGYCRRRQSEATHNEYSWSMFHL